MSLQGKKKYNDKIRPPIYSILCYE